MAGSLTDPGTGDTTPGAFQTIAGTGTPNDGKHVDEVVLTDPGTGLPMVPGAVTFTTLTIEDGSDVAEGHLADTAAQGDVAGSVEAHLRGLNKAIGAIADAAWSSGAGSLVALLKAIKGAMPALGQAAMAASLPVTLASDQSALPVTSVDVDQYFQAHDYTASSAQSSAIDMTGTAGLVYSLQITADGTVTSWTVTIEGSMDGTNWGTILTNTSGSLTLNSVASATAKPLRYVRTNCTALVLNSATKITAQLLALR